MLKRNLILNSSSKVRTVLIPLIPSLGAFVFLSVKRIKQQLRKDGSLTYFGPFSFGVSVKLELWCSLRLLWVLFSLNGKWV